MAFSWRVGPTWRSAWLSWGRVTRRVWFVLWWTGRTACLAVPYRLPLTEAAQLHSWWNFSCCYTVNVWWMRSSRVVIERLTANAIVATVLRRRTWTGDFKCREVKTGFYRNRSMKTGSSGTLIGWKSGQTTFVPLWDWMEGAWLRTLASIPASSDTVESEGRQMKHGWISYINVHNKQPSVMTAVTNRRQGLTLYVKSSLFIVLI